MSTTSPARAGTAEINRTGPGWFVIIGMVSFLLGLVPWLITGLRLPLQNLWAVEVSPERMPIVLLPFSQYTLSLIAGMIIFGASAAGSITRWRAAAGRRRATLFSATGWLSGFAIAMVQTSWTLEKGLTDDTRSRLYLGALVGTALLAAVIGLVALALLALARPAAASVGGTLAALAAGVWVNGLIVPFGTVGSPAQSAILGVAHWLPAVLVGLMLTWCGFGSPARIVAWVIDLVLLWVVPAGLTAVSYGAGSRVLARYPADMLDAGAQVFGLALGPAGVSLRYVAVALVIGVAGCLTRRFVVRDRPVVGPDPAEG